MFTGIVEATAQVKEVRDADSIRFARIALPPRWSLKNGQSISINGICTTVIASTKRSFDVEYMPETMRKTTAGAWKAGAHVNLERSLQFGDRVDGQLLSGHVDGTANITSITKEGASKLMDIALSSTLSKKVSLHGWIAIDGVSLTVARKRGSHAVVALVPYTLAHTTLKERLEGDAVNVETDRGTVSAYESGGNNLGTKGRKSPRRRDSRR